VESEILLQVKKPLACALHEIARILGPDRAERELTTLLETFLRDNSKRLTHSTKSNLSCLQLDDEIKYGAIKNLANFLKVFDLDKREHFVEIFVQLQKDQKKWRIRELIARQIHILAEIFTKETIFRMILPISIKLCNDIVSIVREEASKQIYSLVLSLYDSEEGYRETSIETVRLLSNSTKFSQRQA
jgi:serine/threonine-protein phosphatase 4 regulatory subunit 1